MHGQSTPILLLAGAILAGCAAIQPAAAPSTADVEARFRQAMPKTQVTEVRVAPVSGLYEVAAGRNVFYVDSEVKYIVMGSIYDIANQLDLTTVRAGELNRIDFAQLPEKAAIVIKQGTGQHKVAVFSDPDCPFCKKIEPELAKLQDTTIYVYLMPLPMHTDAARKSAAVWCDKDPAAAWRSLMISGKEPGGGAKCGLPIADVAKVAKAYGIKATPTLVSGDGKIHAGFMPAEKIHQWISGGKS